VGQNKIVGERGPGFEDSRVQVFVVMVILSWFSPSSGKRLINHSLARSLEPLNPGILEPSHYHPLIWR